MEAYAKRHGLRFRCVQFEEPNRKEAYWRKITETLRAFDQGVERVFWLDADQAITNLDIPPLVDVAGFMASKDWGNDAKSTHDFSMCGYVVKSDLRRAFEHVNSRHDECIDGDFPEQTPMREYFRANQGRFWLLPRRTLNAVPDEISPGNVVEPWQPGDFAAHITMLPIEDRVRIFHDIMRRSGQ